MVVGICSLLFLIYLKVQLFAFLGSRLKQLGGGLTDSRIRLFAGALSDLFRGRTVPSGAVFRSKPEIMSRSEQKLFLLLVNALPDHFVFGQVAYSQILRVEGGDYKENFALKATMKQKVADFVICGKEFNIVAVVELDDPTHDGKSDKDARRDENLHQAGLKTIRWHVSRMPDRDNIRWEVLGLKAGLDGEQVSRWAPRPSDLPS